MTLTIEYNLIDLKKATMQGLELLLEMLLCQEWYEKCTDVRDEIKKRKTPTP